MAEITDKDVLLTLDALDGIRVGDEVQLDIREDVPVSGRYGMDPVHHNRWVAVSAVEKSFDPNRRYGHHFYVSFGVNYIFPIHSIKGWRRKEKANG